MTTTLSQERDAPELETHDDAVNFVMDVFRSMGGTVIPGRRPLHIPRYTPLTVGRDNFYMDFENDILRKWDSRKKAHPKGPNRCKDPEWAAIIQSEVYPHHSDIDWHEYVEWVENGGGDEWFQEEGEALFCTRHQNGPLDVWYDCDACVQEVREGPMPQDGRYT